MRKQFEIEYWLKEWEFEKLSAVEQRQAKRDYVKYLANPTESFKYPRYVDVFGNEITLEERAKLFENHEYKVVEQSEVNWYLLSTVWLWLNHWDDKAPLYFETMIFKLKDDWAPNPDDLYQNRYTTRTEAVEKHKELLQYMHDTGLLPNYTT